MQERSVLLVWGGDASILLLEFHWKVAPGPGLIIVATVKAFLASALLTFSSKTAFFYAEIVRAVCAIFGISGGIRWNQVESGEFVFSPGLRCDSIVLCLIWIFYW